MHMIKSNLVAMQSVTSTLYIPLCLHIPVHPNHVVAQTVCVSRTPGKTQLGTISVSKAKLLTKSILPTPKGHESSKENRATIIKQEQCTGSRTSISIVPEVTPLITKWTHEEIFPRSIADIITV